jgi:DNA-binding transcriptional LysR family regulator
MELRNIRALVEVEQRGGFSAAAKVLGMTQPTVSKAIQQLEHDCGFPLIERLGKGVELTTAGEIVYRRGLNMLTERDHLMAELAGLRGLTRGRLKLGIPLLGSSLIFAPLMAAYRRKFPEIEIELHEHGSARLEEAVRAGEIEIGSSLLPVPDDFRTQPLRDEPLTVLLPEGHTLAKRKKLKLEELKATPFILYESGFAFSSVILNACRRHGFVPIEAARSGNPDFIVALVASGLGIALMPRMVVESGSFQSIHCVPLDEDDLRWQLVHIWRYNAVLSPAATSWLQLVSSVMHPEDKNPNIGNVE